MWILAFFAVSFAILFKMVNDGDDRKQSLWKRKWDDDAQEKALAEIRKNMEIKEQEKQRRKEEKKLKKKS